MTKPSFGSGLALSQLADPILQQILKGWKLLSTEYQSENCCIPNHYCINCSLIFFLKHLFIKIHFEKDISTQEVNQLPSDNEHFLAYPTLLNLYRVIFALVTWRKQTFFRAFFFFCYWPFLKRDF